MHNYKRGAQVELLELSTSAAGQTRGRTAHGWVSLRSSKGVELFEALLGLGRIVALHHRSSLYHIH